MSDFACGIDLEKYRRHFLGPLAETFLSPAARADLAEAFSEIEALRAEALAREVTT